MGDCLYLRAPDIQSKDPHLRVLASEAWWFDPAAVGVFLAEDAFLNSTTGVWLYDTDLLNDRSTVVANLRALADLVESGEIDELHRKAPRKTVRRRRTA